MKLGPISKLNKRNKTASKKSDDDVMPGNCDVIVTLEQSGSGIPNAWSVKLIFSLIVTFYLTKTENRTKKSLAQLSHYCFE